MIHCRGFACVPPKDVEVLTPSFQNVILIGDKVFADAYVEMRSVGWILIQCDWCPYQRGKFRQRARHR